MNYLHLPNDALLKAYYHAKKLNLDNEFIKLLEEELQLRQLSNEIIKPVTFNKE